MCLILFGTIDNIKKLDLKQAFDRNSDGAGIVVLGKPAIMTKGYMRFKPFIKAIRRIPKGSNVAVHLRKATHGKISPEYTHPFDAGHNCWLMHNGVFSSFGERGLEGKSDSAHLATILSYLPLEEKLALLTQLTSYTNRCILTQHDTFATFGTWDEHNNVKMSNPMLIPSKVYSYAGFDNQMGFKNDAPKRWNGRSYFRDGRWTDDIVEESKPAIYLPLPTPVADSNDVNHQTEQAALPFRKSEIEELFKPSTKEDREFEEFLAKRRYFGD